MGVPVQITLFNTSDFDNYRFRSASVFGMYVYRYLFTFAADNEPLFINACASYVLCVVWVYTPTDMDLRAWYVCREVVHKPKGTAKRKTYLETIDSYVELSLNLRPEVLR